MRLRAALLTIVMAIAAFCYCGELPREANALVRVAVASLRGGPAHSAELETQALMGTPVAVDFCDSISEWLLCRVPDGYEAYINRSAVEEVDSASMARWKSGRRYVGVDCYESHILELPEAGAGPVSDFVLGCIVEVDEDASTDEWVAVEIPDGRRGFLPRGVVEPFEAWMTRGVDSRRVMEVARSLMGAAYLWGGTSTKGVDCSGLTQLCYFDSGLLLPRNASGQALCGKGVVVDVGVLRQGDLLFFGNECGRIVHVAVYDRDSRYVHSSGMVHESSFDETDDFYNGRRVDFARRVGEGDMSGVVRVAEHPWYF